MAEEESYILNSYSVKENKNNFTSIERLSVTNLHHSEVQSSEVTECCPT